MPALTATDLASALDHLRAAPSEEGTLAMLVRRPARGEREILAEAVIDVDDGLVGDNWYSRATSRAIAAGRHRDAMITVMGSRMAELLGDTDDVRALAGDQLYVDLDISQDNLPAGSRIAIGDDVVLEVSAKPHAGCAKFQARFGEATVSFVNGEEGSRLRLRGLNASVVTGGVVHLGDVVRRGR